MKIPNQVEDNDTSQLLIKVQEEESSVPYNKSGLYQNKNYLKKITSICVPFLFNLRETLIMNVYKKSLGAA